MLIANNKSVKKNVSTCMRFELRSLPLTSIILVQGITTQPRLSLPSVVYNSACILLQSGVRSGRGVRAVAVATLNVKTAA